jgi:molybdopterin biosynthesis enzyme MoaB
MQLLFMIQIDRNAVAIMYIERRFRHILIKSGTGIANNDETPSLCSCHYYIENVMMVHTR